MGKKLTKKQKQQINKTIKNHWKIIVVIILLLAILFAVAYYMGWLDKFFKPVDDTPLSQAGGHSTTVQTLDDLQINFIDVGQGDCIIIELPDGKNMIIDSGEYSEAKNAITEFTTANGITTFDYLLLTHQDSDHAGNMSWVIDNYNVKYIFRPNNFSDHSVSANLPTDFNYGVDGGFESTTKTYANFMVSAYNENCIVEVFCKDSDFSNNILYNNTTYSYSFNFLTPTASRAEIVYGDPNNYSPLVMLEYANRKIMFTGDAELENLEEYVTTYGNTYNVDILKVGHHGSSNATTLDFVQAIDPEYAIIQCGLDNSYGHPHSETLDILSNHGGGVSVYRNDTNGNITLNITSSGDISFDLESDDVSQNYTDGESMIINFNFDLFNYIDKRSLIVA